MNDIIFSRGATIPTTPIHLIFSTTFVDYLYSTAFAPSLIDSQTIPLLQQNKRMDYEGSVISACTSVATDSRTEERTLLQRCLFMRDYLQLKSYRRTTGENAALSDGPHVKISSKVLKECYVLPADGECIENVFSSLAELMRDLKRKKTKPPRTDFTCLSRLEHNKVFIDVDCMACKNNMPLQQTLHFSITKSIKLIISTVSTVFNEDVAEGVYMTTGGSSCGYHLFFNTLTYSKGGVTGPMLMDAIDNTFKHAKLLVAAVDRGCTQMPLPTASHSNSTRHATPYCVKYDYDNSKLVREKLVWVDMDADTLKCFSSIAFPTRYSSTLSTRRTTLSPPTASLDIDAAVTGKENTVSRQIAPPTKNGLASPPTESRKSDGDSLDGVNKDVMGFAAANSNATSDGGRIAIDDTNSMDGCNMDTNSETVDSNSESDNSSWTIRKRKRKMPTDGMCNDDNAKMVEIPVTKRTCLARETSNEMKPNIFTGLLCKGSPVVETATPQGMNAVSDFKSTPPLMENDSDMASLISTCTDATNMNSFVCEGLAQSSSVIPAKDDSDAASLISARTQATNLNSFTCVGFVPPSSIIPVSLGHRQLRDRHERQPNSQYHRRKKNGGVMTCNTSATGSINVLGSLPYECEKDKTSPFADKQYKAALLCAEEAEAMASKANLSLANQDHRRVYIVPGSSSSVTREYKLLVQLVNVNRSVYGGDLVSRRKWTDLLVAYFDQHLHNPVLLEIIKFVLGNKDVQATFDRIEAEEVKQSLVHLMAQFRKRDPEEDAARLSTDLEESDNEREAQEARPHKARIVGALIRVCTQLFGMVTAIVSDLKRVQLAMEIRDLSLLNRTVVNSRSAKQTDSRQPVNGGVDECDDDLDCSASMLGGEGDRAGNCSNDNATCTTNYMLIASLIVHEQTNVSDQALYAFLYYYHSFPSITIDRLLDEIHHDGLMVTAFIKYYMMYDHRGKPLTLQEIFDGFNDAVISLSGPENFILLRRKGQRRGGGGGERKKNNTSKSVARRGGTSDNTHPRHRNNHNRRCDRDSSEDAEAEEGGDEGAAGSGDSGGVTSEEVQKLLSGVERKRRRLMCSADGGAAGERPHYEWKDKHLWQAVINYYLRPVVMHEDRLVFANNSYDTFEDDAVESCVAHIMTKGKNTKADVTTAFKDARTVWRMHHSSQFVYESDLMSDTVGCCFHINIALKMYEMFCGGCVTRMKRVHKNYLIDRSRFNMTVYDVVAECRTATVDLTSAIDRSYMNLLLRQPVVPPFLEDDEQRQLFMSETDMNRGSFSCLSVMDYRRAVNLFERSNCQSRPELETCDYVEDFLDDLYTNEVAAESPPDMSAENRMRILYAFYSLYLYEVLFSMRHTYARRENCYVSVERLSYELDIHELLILFFGKSSMRRVEGLSEELECRIRQTVQGWDNTSGGSALNGDHLTDDMSADNTNNSGFEIRPALIAEIPDKMLRMKTLFGQFGFDVMQDHLDTDLSFAASSSSTCKQYNIDSSRSMENSLSDKDVASLHGDDSQSDKNWDDENKFEYEFYASENWTDTVCERIQDNGITGKTHKQAPSLSAGTSRESVFLPETVRSVLRLELKRHIDHDRMGKLTSLESNRVFTVMKRLPMRLKLLALILTTHTFKLKTKTLASDFIADTYCEAGGLFAEEERYDSEQSNSNHCESRPEKVWNRTIGALLKDRRPLLLHARWLAEKRFKHSFFVGLDPARVYGVLYEYMKDNKDRYPAFKRYMENEDTGPAAANLCTAMMYILVMSAYDQEHLDLYLRVFLAVEWPGQWAKTIFVWKSNSNAGKSYLFDSIIKRACANSTCINDPKGGKENAPEKAEYVKNFVLFANEFSQANSNELKKIVSESTFKFRMNYGNVMNEAYTTGKIMFNCNTLPPTSDEAAINRLTLFNIPFWFSRRQRISDAMLNWICGLGPSLKFSRWELAYRYELPSLLSEAEKTFLESHSETKNETDLFNGYAALRPSHYSMESNKALSPLFLVQNKTSRVYALSCPPTDHIVHGLVNITNHFSWLRFFKRLDTPVDFSTMPASSEAVRSEWLSLTLPYQEWKQLTGAKIDPTCRVSADIINKSLQAFAAKKNINYFGIRQFFETDFASSREAIKDEYYIKFDAKVLSD